jgi:predicted nucleotidyltransferase
VDVVVELEPGASHRALADLEDTLERLLERDVDVVLSDLLRDGVRREVEREGVSLLG